MAVPTMQSVVGAAVAAGVEREARQWYALPGQYRVGAATLDLGTGTVEVHLWDREGESQDGDLFAGHLASVTVAWDTPLSGVARDLIRATGINTGVEL